MLWQKDTRVADWALRFTVGEDYRWDTILLPYDLEGTKAHAWGLTHIGILTADEYLSVAEALDAIGAAWAAGEVLVRPEDEDCHTVIEGRLTERLGDVGKKIHTGRSRNDQVLTALRLFLREALRARARQTAALAGALCTLAEGHDDVLMPGYTHLQPAMPTTPALWALGYAETLAADLDALRHALDAVNVSPLGSAAGYGVPHLPLPRQAVAERLGFRAVQTHVTAVQIVRGKLELHAVHACLQVAATVNRLSADLVMFNMAEFGFVELPAEYCTGSSIMPQKQNPDVLELARATFHRIAAEAQVLITLPANLPSGYHRDLQLTKESAMRSLLLTEDLLTAMNHVVPGLRFRRDKMAEAVTPALFATAEALAAVRDGVPFREAYRTAARSLADLTVPPAADALATYHADGFPGHTRPDLVRAMIDQHTEWLTS